jgi:hypothetical protein
MIAQNIASLAQGNKAFSVRGRARARNASDIFAAAFVATGTQTQTTRKCTRGNAGLCLCKTGCFALKRSLGERYAAQFMLARVLELATRYGVSQSVAHSTGCV